MKEFKQKLKYIVLISLILVSTSSFAREDGSYRVGMVIGTDYIISHKLSHKIGFLYEWVPKWCGIEAGAYWRTSHVPFEVSIQSKVDGQMVSGLIYRAKVNTHYITIPLLWRLQFKSISFSLGPEIEYYVGYTVKKAKDSAEIVGISYNESPPITFGAIFKMGVPIHLNENWIIEPELRTGLNINKERFFIGLGVAIKFGR